MDEVFGKSRRTMCRGVEEREEALDHCFCLVGSVYRKRRRRRRVLRPGSFLCSSHYPINVSWSNAEAVMD
jgi:hypothetical protein